jgi:mannose-6-phosphate isomerase-like protein (cupin superfamily)
MKVEIEDIKRVVLEPNEVLVIKMPKNHNVFSSNKIDTFLESLTKTNHSLKGRVLVIRDGMELSAVTKK